MFRIIQRRNAILDDAAPDDLRRSDLMPDAALKEQLEIHVDQREELGFEGIEPFKRDDLGMRLLPQDPVVPAVARLSSGERLQGVTDGSIVIADVTQGHDQRCRDVRVAALSKPLEGIVTTIHVSDQKLANLRLHIFRRSLRVRLRNRTDGKRQCREHDEYPSGCSGEDSGEEWQAHDMIQQVGHRASR
ncbi:MAG: hypothetical protein CL569_04120 [Alphaproteobacteria bacterium]|nr:hypothetical protein [Alphaproteobacteria bacterium]